MRGAHHKAQVMSSPIALFLWAAYVQRASGNNLVPRVALPATNSRRGLLTQTRSDISSARASALLPPALRASGHQPQLYGKALQNRAPVAFSSSSFGVPGEWDAALPQPTAQPQADQYHRWITKEDPTFEDSIFLKQYGGGYLCETPGQYCGTRKKGNHPGSSRVEFTLLGKDAEPQTIEFLHSNEKDNPSFGAVRVKLPADARVVSKGTRLVVEKIGQGSNADNSKLRQGDIIRAISVPEATDKADVPWWGKLGRRPLPEAENGMVILDGRSLGDLQAVMDENSRVLGKGAEVVMLIERPAVIFKDDDGGTFFRGGRPAGYKRRDLNGELIPELIPIPVPTEEPTLFPPGPSGGSSGYPGPLRSDRSTPPVALIYEDSESRGATSILLQAALASCLLGTSAAAVAFRFRLRISSRHGFARSTKEPLLVA